MRSRTKLLSRLLLSPRLLLPGLQCALLQVSSKDLQGAIGVVPAPTDGMQTAVHDVALLKVGRGARM